MRSKPYKIWPSNCFAWLSEPQPAVTTMTPSNSKIAIGFSLVFAALVSAHADISTPLVDVQQNAVTDANGNWLMNQYVVTNNTDRKENHIHAFGATISSPMPVWTTRQDWHSETLSKNAWNNGSVIDGCWFFNGDCKVWHTGVKPLADTSYDLYLGSFEYLFGTDGNYVNFYYEKGGYPLTTGNMSDEFFFSTPLAPFEYAGFSADGRVTYQSFNVPEPGSSLLVGIALLGVAGTRRRQNA